MNDDKDEPLSPEAEEVMAKARRRAGLSMLIMMVGFMAIALVVVYRLSAMNTGVAERYGAQAIVLPQGAQVISSQVSDGMVTVTYEAGGEMTIAVFDGSTGEQVGSIAVVAQ